MIKSYLKSIILSLISVYFPLLVVEPVWSKQVSWAAMWDKSRKTWLSLFMFWNYYSTVDPWMLFERENEEWLAITFLSQYLLILFKCTILEMQSSVFICLIVKRRQIKISFAENQRDRVPLIPTDIVILKG